MSRWTTSQTKELVRLWPTHGSKDIAIVLGKSDDAIRNRARYLKLVRKFGGVLWTEKQTETLVRLWLSRTSSNIGAIIGKSASAVKRKANALNLVRKSNAHKPLVWTDERNEALRLAWAIKKNTSGTIALDLGASKTSIQKQASRLGLTAKPQNSKEWPVSNIEKLKSLWPQNISVEKIAIQIGVTKGAVSGMAGRLKLAPKKKSPGLKRTRKPVLKNTGVTRAARATARIVELKQAAEQFNPPSETGVTFAALEPHHCRWPFGDSPNMFFCGHTQIDGFPYCDEHCQIAYETVNQRIARAKERLRVAA